jgi:sec-independent protein translocase protein TatA
MGPVVVVVQPAPVTKLIIEDLLEGAVSPQHHGCRRDPPTPLRTGEPGQFHGPERTSPERQAPAPSGPGQRMVGLVIAVGLFGAKKLPELAGSVGKSLKEFKKGMVEATEESPAAPKATQPTVLPTARMCTTCQTPLQAEWQHCPRCGASPD